MNDSATPPKPEALPPVPSSLPPHRAEKGFLSAGLNTRWWRLYSTDGKWTPIGPGGKTLKLARQHALDAIREANAQVEARD
jgi:hypothetical protein